MAEKISHLDENKIIAAVVDEMGLDKELREHLLTCPICLARKEALTGSLTHFTRLSHADAPVDFRKPRILKQAPAVATSSWIYRPALGFALAAAILTMILSPGVTNRDKIYLQNAVYREMIQDEKFMSEIEKLEENPLPKTYVDIGSPGEDDGDAPPATLQHDSMTGNSGSSDA